MIHIKVFLPWLLKCGQKYDKSKKCVQLKAPSSSERHVEDRAQYRASATALAASPPRLQHHEFTNFYSELIIVRPVFHITMTHWKKFRLWIFEVVLIVQAPFSMYATSYSWETVLKKKQFFWKGGKVLGVGKLENYL